LKYLAANHKPNQWANPANDLVAENLVADKLSRTIAKIIRYYHPDKAEQGDGSKEWFYQEITKFLTSIIAELKA
jgi:hypothetical protein